MGFDLERFVGYVNDGLLCCVCRDVLERPLQAPCEHSFCSACISSWLLHHNSCPEDRLPLDIGSLKPLYRSVSIKAEFFSYLRRSLHNLFGRWLSKLFCSTALALHLELIIFVVSGARYMRNDLNRLQIRCVNAGQGCEMVCSLENLHTHEDECEFAFISCSNTGMATLSDGLNVPNVLF